VTSEDATGLFYLRCLWHGAYAISLTDGIWVARRRDNPPAPSPPTPRPNCVGCCGPTTADGCEPGREAIGQSGTGG
jgi:hypothetical protein